MENLNDKEAVIQAHKYCMNHKSSLMNDKICGCFYCLKVFAPNEIEHWIDDKIDKTALCPYCEIDSVIGESCGFPITENFLKKMNAQWF